MKIAAKLHWNSRNDALVGHSMSAQEMSTLCDLYTNLEKRETPANTDYVKQTLWRDMTSDCDIVGPYYTSSGPFKAKTMLPCVLDALRKFHCHGFDVCALVCDGASSNLTMIKTLLGKKSHFAVQKDLSDPHEVQAHFKNPWKITHRDLPISPGMSVIIIIENFILDVVKAKFGTIAQLMSGLHQHSVLHRCPHFKVSNAAGYIVY